MPGTAKGSLLKLGQRELQQDKEMPRRTEKNSSRHFYI